MLPFTIAYSAYFCILTLNRFLLAMTGTQYGNVSVFVNIARKPSKDQSRYYMIFFFYLLISSIYRLADVVILFLILILHQFMYCFTECKIKSSGMYSSYHIFYLSFSLSFLLFSFNLQWKSLSISRYTNLASVWSRDLRDFVT